MNQHASDSGGQPVAESPPKFAWGARSRQAWAWLVGWFIFLACLAAVLWLNPSLELVHYGQWTNRDVAVVAGLVGLLVAASVMHLLDDRLSHRGFAHVHHSHRGKAHFQVDDAAVSGILAVQSIRAALTAGILVALLGARSELSGNVLTRPIQWAQVSKSPAALIFCAVGIVLATSVITTLVGLLCYDYSLRFQWTHAPEVKKNLRHKAHRLGVWGFYALMWSLAAATALIDYYLWVAAIGLVFWAAWWYYFFPKNILDG